MRQVDPDLYTSEYYLQDCGGHHEWKQTKGKQLPIRLKIVFDLAQIRSGMEVVDFGCGRGEISYQAASRSASVLGLDYSKQAISLAKKIPKDTPGKTTFKVNKKLSIPKKDNTVDVIFFIDVYEHLYPEQIQVLLKEFFRVLKPGGQVITHTAPNRHYYDYGYPYFTRWMSMLANPIWKRVFHETLITQKDLRTEYEKTMHVNEPIVNQVDSDFSQAGFSTKTWLTSDCQIFRKRDQLRYILLQPQFGPLKHLFSYDILSVATKPNKSNSSL